MAGLPKPGIKIVDKIEKADLVSITRPRKSTALGPKQLRATSAALNASFDHGEMQGLGDDDHTIYLLADGTRDLTGNMLVDSGITIDGRDLSVDGAVLDALVAEQAILERGWDGAMVETIDIDVTESGGVVSLELQAQGGGDLTIRSVGESYTLDCTPAQTVALTAGTDISPTLNYVYVLESGGTLTLTASTAGFPSTGHAPVATVMVQSAASVAIDGAYKVHAWTDHIYSGANNGHISHLNAKFRALPASWIDGCAPADMVVSSPDAYISTTAGNVYQLHSHVMPAIDMQTGDPVFLVNDPTTNYKRITTFDDITQDAGGNAINNKYMNLVLWGVVSENESECKLFINLPSDVYTTEAAAQTDDNNYAVYGFPEGYAGTAFLIARYTVKAQTSGAWVQSQKIDLRGLVPSTSPSGGSLTDHGALAGLTDDDHTQYLLADGSRDITGAQFTREIQVRTGSALIVLDAGNTDYAGFTHDGADFNQAHVNTVNLNLTGLTGAVKSDSPVKIKESAAAVSDTAGYGQDWVKTATPNEKWFTDDAGNDFRISPEYGNWTPALGDGTNTATLSTAVGEFQLVDGVCHYWGRIVATSLGSMSGSSYITGFPFTSGSDTHIRGALVAYQGTLLNVTAGYNIVGNMGTSSTFALLQVWDNAVGCTNLQASEISANGTLRFWGSYLVA